MKRFIFGTGIILSFVFANSYAQNFFPLQVGNQYQIKEDWDVSGPGYTNSGTYFKVLSILNDTLINGYYYYSFNNLGSGGPFPGNSLFRYDSLNQKLLVRIDGDDTLRIAADFNALADSHYTSYIEGEPKEFISSGISSKIVLGDTFLVYGMETPWSGNTIIHYDFADNIGLTYFRYVYINPPTYGSEAEYNTISAIINSSSIHPLVLKIDSLYPAIDRPIDTFPFMLNIPFHVSYSQLISSFQLALEVERDTGIVYSMNYNISTLNPHIQINPPGLEVGDIIKLRATISDTSIYNNSDVFPHTGWTIIHVLPPVLGTQKVSYNYSYKLEQNFPNPFNPVSIIKYEIPEMTHVSLKVFGILGNEIATLVDEIKPAGNYEIKFDGHNLSSGVYIYQLKTDSFVQTKKMILTK